MEIDPKLVKRMVAYIRRTHEEVERQAALYHAGEVNKLGEELREIAKLLPEPADPDLVEAREIAVTVGSSRGYGEGWVADTRKGLCDDYEIVQSALAALRRGRQLALDGRRGE